MKAFFGDKSKILEKITFIVFCFAIIMLGVYFYNFKEYGISDYIEDWAGFGSYFASITGLLAFVGVLYSASLSEKRALKAEIEFNQKEDREFFFKSIDLLKQNSIEMIKYNNAGNETTISSIDRDFRSEVFQISQISFAFFLKDFFWHLDTYRFKNLISNLGSSDLENYFIQYLIQINNIEYTKNQTTLIRTKDQLDFELSKKNIYIDKSLCYSLYYKSQDLQSWIDILYDKSGLEFTSQNIFQILINTSGYYFFKSSDQLKSFCNTYHYIIDFLYSSNLDKNKCLKILNSQISKGQLTILYIYLFKKDKNVDYIQLFDDYNIFTHKSMNGLFLFKSLSFIDDSEIKKINKELFNKLKTQVQTINPWD